MIIILIITSWYALPADFLAIALVSEGLAAFWDHRTTLPSPFSEFQIVWSLFWDGQAFPFWEFLASLFPFLGFQPPKYCWVKKKKVWLKFDSSHQVQLAVDWRGLRGLDFDDGDYLWHLRRISKEDLCPDNIHLIKSAVGVFREKKTIFFLVDTKRVILRCHYA